MHPDDPAIRKDWARLYDQMTMMDAAFGARIAELKQAGLYDSTIIFYYSDHGGVMSRSKRFLYDSGTRVPLIVRVPEKWCQLLPGPAGSQTNQFVTLMDTSATVAKIAGVALPGTLHAKPFLGITPDQARTSAYLGSRRVDESMDFARAVRTEDWLLIANFHPQRARNSFTAYGYLAAGWRAWRKLFDEGKTNELQSADFLPKPGIQLFNAKDDPHQVKNLSDDPKHAKVKEQLLQMMKQQMIELTDAGFSPEGISDGVNYETRTDAMRYPLAQLMDIGFALIAKDGKHLPLFTAKLSDPNPKLRYWAAYGIVNLGSAAASAQAALEPLLSDPDPLVRIAVAEALVAIGQPVGGRAALETLLIAHAADDILPLHIGQAYLSFWSELKTTPKSVFTEALLQSTDHFVGARPST